MQFLKPTFAQSYTDAITKNADRHFLSVYLAHGKHRSATFSEFNRDVERAAATINHLSKEPKVVVTIGGNTYEHLVFIIAAILSGKTLCPLNLEDSVERVTQKLASLCEPYAVFTNEPTFNSLPNVFSMSLSIAPNDPPCDWQEFNKDQAMILIFTSGSTGYAKIVEQMEMGILTNCEALIAHHRLSPKTCIGTPLPIFHVNALEFSFFCTLFSGSRLVLWERPIFSQINQVSADEGCTILSLVPTLLKNFILYADEFMQTGHPSLMYFVSAAAPLSTELVMQVLNKLNLRIVQGYGLSEAINFSCIMPIELKREAYEKWMSQHRWPSVGIPLPGTSVTIRDANGLQLAEGEQGEICIQGATVMNGYRCDRNSQNFKKTFLPTGDIGCFHCDNEGHRYFFVTGRIKDIVKKNGVTVSLREVDEILEGVLSNQWDSVAIPFANDFSGEDIGVVIRIDTCWTPEIENEMARQIEARLPRFIRPTAIIKTLARLRTPSGKPLRHRFIAEFKKFEKLSLGTTVRFFDSEQIDTQGVLQF